MRVATTFSRLAGLAGAAILVVALGGALPGCTLDEDEAPALIGPSETGISAQLIAAPDVVNADGVSESVIELILRDQNGAPAAGRAVQFDLETGDGTLRPSAASTYVGPLQFDNSFVMATSDSGTAVVVYQAGHSSTTVTVTVRPYNFDATRPIYSFIEILQR